MSRRKQLFLLMLCLTMMLLMSGKTAYANIVLRPPGTVLSESAYVVSIQDGRDTLKLIDSQSAEIKALWDGINKKDEQIDRLVAISEELTVKNEQLNNKFEKEKRKRFGVGIFAGVSHQGEAVFGIGITYSLFKF